MIASVVTLHHVLTLFPNMISSEVPGASEQKTSGLFLTLQEILSKGSVCHKCECFCRAGKQMRTSRVKLLKRKHSSLYTAQKFLISITMTCFATVATDNKNPLWHKDRLYPAE